MKTIDEIANFENLEVIETTSARNGYPENIKKAVIGLDNFEQAEELAKKYGLSIETFAKRDGWQLYYRTNDRVLSAIEVTEEQFGDNYRAYTSADLKNFYEDEVQGRINEFNNFEDVEEFLAGKKKIYEVIENADSDEIVLACDGKYYDTVKKFTMCHYHDTNTTVIGLIYR